MRAPLDILAERWPSLNTRWEDLRTLSAHTRGIVLAAFHEPPTPVLSQPGSGKASVPALDGPLLESWKAHVSSSVAVRMRALEDAILNELINGRTLPAMVLLRSHLESAAKACHALEAATEAAAANDWEPMRLLYQRHLFGTSVRTAAKDRPDLKQLLRDEEQETVRATSAIAALDRFFTNSSKPGPGGQLYSLLCEYAHPNSRGTADLIDATGRIETGWQIQYRWDECNEDTTARASDSLLFSMRCGYAARHFLLGHQFVGGADSIVVNKPARDVSRFAWQALLQRAVPESDAHE
jgi:hypothetical protein